MIKFSIILPVYNRPREVDELLQCLTQQTYSHFEVLVIEDGSSERCQDVADKYRNLLDIRYLLKENSGQGFTRNYGFARAKGDYFIIFDSDCLIPPHYLLAVYHAITTEKLDCFGGPDKAHESFTPVQKAINYAMTSPFTTGGIRGRKKHLGQFHPRSFNMGLSRKVYEQVGGFAITRMAEDLEYSIRIIRAGFKTALVPEAYVYHKRRTNLGQFFRQLHFFGRARIDLSRFYPQELKLIHAFPAVFTLGMGLLFLLLIFSKFLLLLGSGLYILYIIMVFVHASLLNRSIYIGFLSIAASVIQLIAYGTGFIREWIKKSVKG